MSAHSLTRPGTEHGMELGEIAAGDAEQALLVAALRGVHDLPAPEDELRLAAVASWQRLEGVMAGVLEAHPTGSRDLTDHFVDARTATARRYDRLRLRLADLLTAMDAEGITATVLKGAAVVETGLVEPGERPMADVDLMVAVADADQALDIARTLGLSSVAADPHWTHARTRHHHFPALDDGNGTTVELHHRLLDVEHPLSRLDELCQTRTVGLANLPGRRLDDVAMWLHAAVHFWDDRRRGTGGPLLQLRDLHLLLRRLDPTDLVAAARQARAESLVGTVAAVLETVVPGLEVMLVRAGLGGPTPGDPRVHEFVRQRILGRRSALAQLVHPTGNVPYTAWRLATRARRQAWPPLADIHRVLGPSGTHRDHLASLVPVVGDAVRSPGATWADVQLDHWAHGAMTPGR